MTRIQEGIVEKLQRSGPCCLDDVVMHLSPFYSWGEVFVAVDWMSREGGVVGSTTRLLDLSDHSPVAGYVFRFAIEPNGVAIKPMIESLFYPTHTRRAIP